MRTTTLQFAIFHSIDFMMMSTVMYQLQHHDLPNNVTQEIMTHHINMTLISGSKIKTLIKQEKLLTLLDTLMPNMFIDVSNSFYLGQLLVRHFLTQWVVLALIRLTL